MNILVIKQSSLGDVLHSTAALRAIKEAYPQARLTLLTNNGSVGIVQHNDDIDEIIELPYPALKQHWPKRLDKLIAALRTTMYAVRQREYDLAFDLQGLLRSVLFLYGARAKKKFVKGKWWGLKQFRKKQLHAIDEMAGVLQLAGIPMSSRQMQLASDASDVKALDAVLAKLVGSKAKPKAELIVISPFTRWVSKNWPLAHFVELANRLSEKFPQHAVLLTGAPNDQVAIDEVLADQTNKRVYNLAGALSLAQLGELMRRADLVVSGDSFPMHVASAVQVPLLALFGPTDEQKTGPLSKQALVLRAPDCSKCDKPECQHNCLSKLAVETVFVEAAKKLST